MRIIETAEFHPDAHSPFEVYQVYNGLDCCLTSEILSAMPPPPEPAYSFVRAMQAPALEMMLRGLRVDLFARDMAVRHLEGEIAELQLLLDDMARAVWDKGLNPGSPKAKGEFLYDAMRLPEQLKLNKATGQRVRTTERGALEKLLPYFHSRPIIATILALQDRRKQVGMLRSEIDPDGYMRTSYNVAGTETTRWSASKNAFGSGTNLQNIPDKLRRIFIAEPGRKFAYLDLEQAESRLVGITCFLLFGATNYIDACESGDLHTSVCKLVWPGMPWTGGPEDKDLAEGPFYRDYSFRDMAKRGGHGTNYYGKDYTMAKHLKVDTGIITEFQRQYFLAFPEIRWWHSWVGQQLQLESRLTNIFGLTRDFFGRSGDDTTLREAIAHGPQSAVGQLLNLALWRVWHYRPLGVRVLAQLHDAILIDYPDEPELEAERIAAVSALMRTPITLTSSKGETRTFVIGNDAAVGWNWGKFNDDPARGAVNLAGVKKFKGPESRKRPSDGLLDRAIPGFY